MISLVSNLFDTSKDLILRHNMMFGVIYDFYKEGGTLSKSAQLRYAGFSRCVAPLISGLLIDKTRLLWLCIFVFGVLGILATSLKLKEEASPTGGIFLEELESFSNHGLLCCQIVILSKWF